MSRARASLTDIKAMRSLIKLQPHNGLGSLDTFLMKFQRMASYLQWDEENKVPTHGKLPVMGRGGDVSPSLHEPGESSGTSPLGHRPSTNDSRHRLPPSDKAWNTAPSRAFQNRVVCQMDGTIEIRGVSSINILSNVDSAMHYLWLLPLHHKTAEARAAALFDEVTSRVSAPPPF